MFKGVGKGLPSGSSPNKGSPTKQLKSSSSNDLAVLISRMQKNADQVEKDILETQTKLKKDAVNRQQNKPLEFQQINGKNLKDAETLLKDLFLDVDKVKHLKHPQAFEIEKDIKQLHVRMTHQCAEYRELYEKFTLSEVSSKVDWAKILEQKQKQISGGQYGPTMPELEKQIAEHNILQKEIEAYGLQIKNLQSMEAGDLKIQYKDLLKASIWRSQCLNSLYTHLQGCMKELAYLSEQQQKILKQDWSDQMIDPQSVRREYEEFRNNELLNQEEYVNMLQDDGERMIELKHPAVTPIQAHQEALKNEWQNFLNLCICQEHHLKSIENYKKFYDDVDDMSHFLNKLNNDLDNKYSKFNKNSPGIVSDLMCHLENDEKTVKQAEKTIAELKRRSKEISPLKLRRIQCSQPIIMDAICDWDLGEVQLERGEKYTLNNNSNQENWVVQNAKEESKIAPAVCFSIPPPDLEAIDRVNRLEGELNTMKQKRASIQTTLRSSSKESVKHSHQAAIRTFTAVQDDSEADHLLHKLNKIDNDLGQIKMDIFNRTRSPLNHSDPIEDVTQRIKHQEGTNRNIQIIGTEKEAVQKACETYLSKKPAGTSASQIPVMLNNIKNKYNDVKVLCRLYDEKAKASVNLENQIENVDRIISTIEAKLSHDGTIPASPNALQDRANELQKLKRDLVKQENCLLKLNRSLKDTEHSCSAVQNNFQEYCPDLPRQKKEVQLINDRYHMVADQLDQREKTLWDTSLIYHQFQNANENLIFWLNNLPKHKVKTTDGPSQINYKLEAQKRLADEIQSKESDKNSVINLSRNVQSILNDYELQAGKYRSSLDPTLIASSAKRLRVTPLQESIQAQENDMTKLYAETAAENKQQICWLEFAKKIMNKKEVGDMVQVTHEQTQQSKNVDESEILKSQLKEEQSRKANVQQELEEQRNNLLTLKTQRPIERIEEKEVIDYYRDPVLESDLAKISNQIENEKKTRAHLQADIEKMNNILLEMEKDRRVVKSQLLTKEVTKTEKDPNLNAQAARLQEEIKYLRDNSTSSSEIEQLRKELNLLEQKQSNVQKKVVVKEVVKLEKDPEMLKAIRSLQMQIDEDSFKKKSAMDTIGKMKSKIEDLEKLIEATEPQVVVREIKQVEQDPELLKESSTLQKLIDEERNKNLSLASELTQLQSKYSTMGKSKPRVEIKERVHEIFHLDPETEEEIAHLKRELQEISRKRKRVDQEVETALTELKVLRSQAPSVEFKEVIQEVVKTEKSPEILREIDRLKEQLNDLVNANGRSQEQLIRLEGERDEWKRERAKVETKVVTKEVVRYENDPLLEKEAECLRQEVRNILQKRRATEDAIYDLQNKHMLLERRKPEEKVVVQEVVVTQKDVKLREEHKRLSRSLDEQIGNRRRMDHEVQLLRATVEDNEKLLNFQDDRNKRLALEKEMRQITLRIKEIEESPVPVQEKIIMEEVIKVEKDPVLEQSSTNLRTELGKEKVQVLSLQRECKNFQAQIEVLQKTKSQEKTIYKEVIRVEKDRVLENERTRLWDLLSKERTARQNAEESIRHLKEKIERAEGMKCTWTREEADLQKTRNVTVQEKASLEDELRELEKEKQQKALFLREQTKLLSQKTESDRQKKIQFDQEVSRLESDILMEKDNIYEKERTIRELQSRINREELNNETQMRETNLSTKISILDPETGKDMSPYEAYQRGMIDRCQYIHLQELECDWEEITTLGSKGDVSVLLDKKSGKQYSIDDALRFKRITKEEYQLYKEGKIPISEFALLVAGETKQNTSLSLGAIISKSPISSPVFQQKQSIFSSGPQMAFCDDTFPIAGVYDTTYDNKYNIKSALCKKLVDPMTAQKLLEAQAATGGIVDLISRDRYSVHKALDKGLIDNTYIQRLLNAQKAFTGIEDPVTKRRLAVGEAVQKGWITQDNAFPYLQVQHLTGGLIDPKKTGRIPISEAIQTGLISSDLATLLQDESSYEKDLVDPITKEKIHYKEAMAHCQKDPLSGLLLLPATSEGYQSAIHSAALPRFRH
ncbi:envoplakin [Notechis scutatus]|uniref:Envoplakin n=1 Tax=Notechis scutatus TaxID=8663 RepID=A0A6J1TXW5_9SAUR|nr:envoplakin [Notechis scutatus]